MKKKEKWTPHTIAVMAFVVFIVLGLACASTTEPLDWPKDYVPPPKHMGLSQAEMDLSNPIILPDYRVGGYWLGTWVPELSEDQVSIIELTTRFYNSVSNFRIDGNMVRNSGFLYLAPGKHIVTFSYHTTERVSTGVRADQYETVNINVPNVRLEIDMQPGKVYNIQAGQSETASSVAGRYLGGYRSGQYSVEFAVNEINWQPKTPSNATLHSGFSIYKFLQPYDPSIPILSQAFLQTGSNIYIVGFNGETVKWGYGESINVTIGVPPGRHTLQLVEMGDDTIYTTTINCVSGSRYVFKILQEEIQVENITRGGSFSVTKTNETFNATEFLPTVPPATFDGPNVTIINGTAYLFVYLYISPTIDSSWGSNRLEAGQILSTNGGFITLSLPYPLDSINRYDIKAISPEGWAFKYMNVEVSANRRITISGGYNGVVRLRQR